MENQPIRSRLTQVINPVLLHPRLPCRVVLCIEFGPATRVHSRGATTSGSYQSHLVRCRTAVQYFELGRLLEREADQDPLPLTVDKIPAR